MFVYRGTVGGFSIHEFPSPSIEYFSKGGSESALNCLLHRLIQVVLESSIVLPAVQPLHRSHKALSIEQISLHLSRFVLWIVLFLYIISWLVWSASGWMLFNCNNLSNPHSSRSYLQRRHDYLHKLYIVSDNFRLRSNNKRSWLSWLGHACCSSDKDNTTQILTRIVFVITFKST